MALAMLAFWSANMLARAWVFIGLPLKCEAIVPMTSGVR